MRSSWTILICLALVAAQDSETAATVPVVVAVDTSRSLTLEELGAVVDRLRGALDALPADTPAGLLAFDDETTWQVELGGTPRDVAAALGELTPRGDYTLLYDALFVASRDLEDGGIVLLATDGRDESSATTVEDIARRSEAQNVRIVSIGTSGRVEERVLRRLALLTNGTYLGPVDGTSTAAVTQALAAAREGVMADLVTADLVTADLVTADLAGLANKSGSGVPNEPQRHPPPATADPPEEPRSEPRTAAEQPKSRLFQWGLLIAILIGVAFLLWRQRRQPEATFDPHYGVEAETALEPPPSDALPVTRDQLLERPVAALFGVREVTGDTAVFQSLGAGETIDETRKLVERNLILVREPGAEPRSYEIGRDKAFAVGRLSGEGNTLSMPDPAMSSHHFRIVPQGGRFYFLDLGSTNGSSVNGQRVDGIRELHSGDVIRAGVAEFEYQSNIEHLRS